MNFGRNKPDLDGAPLDVDGVPLKASEFDGVPIRSVDVDGVPLKDVDLDGVPLSGDSIDGKPSEFLRLALLISLLLPEAEGIFQFFVCVQQLQSE